MVLLPDNDGLERTNDGVDAVDAEVNVEAIVDKIVQMSPILSGVEVTTVPPDEWEKGSPVRASLHGLSIEMSFDHDISQKAVIGLCLRIMLGLSCEFLT